MHSSRKKHLIATFSVLLVCVAALVGIRIIPEQKPAPPVPVMAEDTKTTVVIRAVGDNLMHLPLVNSCKAEDGYNFDCLYKNIESYITAADIAAINQETIFVAPNSSYSGYPSFGSPHQVGESIEKAGFNLVTLATNHTYDRGVAAIEYTMDFWDKRRHITRLGVNKGEEESQKIQIWKKDDLSIALLNFTYGLNGRMLPSDKKYLVNIIDNGEENEKMLKKAEESADITVVFLHFGTEYTHTPTEEQKQTVEFFVQNGADIIIGSHPHVVQPYTKHISENGNEAIVYYSLGNFVSNQAGASKILGAMADITITKEDGKVRVDSYEMHPLVTHCANRRYSVYMLENYTDDLARRHTRASGLTVEKLNELYEKITNIKYIKKSY